MINNDRKDKAIRMGITHAYRAVVACLLLLGVASGVTIAATPASAGPAPTFTFRSSNCASGGQTDPMNVRWFNEDYVAVDTQVPLYLPRWNTVAGGTQYAWNGLNCRAQKFSLGKEFGPPSRDGSKTHREKVHIRLFETGQGQVGGDAHRERKVRCDNRANTTDTFSHDVVYKYFNGTNGFDAAMHQVANAWRARSSSTVSVTRSSGPYVSEFRQCNGTWVPWSGDVAYIFAR